MRRILLVPSLLGLCAAITTPAMESSISSEEVESYVGFIAGSDRGAADQALRELRDLKREAAPALDPLAGLILENRDIDADRRRRIVEILADIAGEEAVPTLIAALDDPFSDVRNRAVRELREAGGEAATEALRSLLGDPNPSIRREAAAGLVRSGDEGALALITQWQGARSVDLRRWAVELARELPDRGRSICIAALGDSSAAVRSVAANGLERVRFGEEDPAEWQAELTTAVLGQLAVEENAQVIYELVRTLDRHQALDQAVERLRTLAAHEEARVRASALQALGRQADADSFAMLQAAVTDPSVDVRRAVARGLGGYKTEAAVAALVSMLGDEDRDVLRNALSALSYSEQTVDLTAVLPLRTHDHRDVRREAVHTLGRIGDDSVVLDLLESVRNDSDKDVRKRSLEALHRLKSDAAVGGLIELLGSPHEDVPQRADGVLKHITGQDLGSDRAAWEAWRSGAATAAPAE
jgi:HEAT repeat protein